MNLILHNTHILVAVHTRVMIVWAIHLCLVLPLFGQDKSTQPVDEDRPNILWLSTEDIGPQLGCYGDPVAKTPNLDALAGRGMLFDVAWSNYPVCAPARTTIITGMYAAANGAGHMRCSRPLPEGVAMFPQLLQQAGYIMYQPEKGRLQPSKTG